MNATQTEYERLRITAIRRAVEEVLNEKEDYAGSERRAAPRRDYAKPIQVVLPSGKRDICVAKDLSVTGISFGYLRPLSGVVIVELSGPAKTAFRLKAEVVRTRRIGRFYEIGAKFIQRLQPSV